MPEPDLELDLPFPANREVARLWDTVYLDGEEYPGKVDVEATIERKVDVRRRRGADGGVITDRGLDPTTVQLVFYAWTPEHFAALRVLQPRFAARQRLRDRAPMDIYHPGLAPLGISQIYVHKVSALKPGSQKGLFELHVEATEFFPPPRRAVTRTPTKTGPASLAEVPTAPTTTTDAAAAGKATPRQSGAANP